MKMENFQADERYAIWYRIEKLYMFAAIFKKRSLALEGLQTEGECKEDRLPEAKKTTAHTHMRT